MITRSARAALAKTMKMWNGKGNYWAAIQDRGRWDWTIFGWTAARASKIVILPATTSIRTAIQRQGSLDSIPFFADQNFGQLISRPHPQIVPDIDTCRWFRYQFSGGQSGRYFRCIMESIAWHPKHISSVSIWSSETVLHLSLHRIGTLISISFRRLSIARRY